MAEVFLQPGERLDSALRRFKRQVLREGILQDAKRRVYYLKPSESKKLKSKRALIRAHRQRRFDAANG
ncbi:MAG: 30S ribosomal protein S21 [Acidobacteria bacterium]|nr:30S ribosomal protein S21 [Acidobacteriota bacterium]